MEDDQHLRDLLQKAKDLIQSGKPFKSLELVVELIKQTRGEEQVLEVLDEAKEAVRKQGYLPPDEYAVLESSLEGKDSAEPPIIAESGKEQFLRDALADGSSFICHRCGALVPIKRRTAHQTMWCEALGDSFDSDGS